MVFWVVTLCGITGKYLNRHENFICCRQNFVRFVKKMATLRSRRNRKNIVYYSDRRAVEREIDLSGSGERKMVGSDTKRY